MGKIERKKIKKKRPIKNVWYEWLINYIPNPIRKTVDGPKSFKDNHNRGI